MKPTCESAILAETTKQVFSEVGEEQRNIYLLNFLGKH
jgi:hypothetical protein